MIVRLRQHDDVAAWTEFEEIYRPLIIRLARNRGLQDADAYEISQEVMARVAAAIERWDPDPERGSFRGWLSRITRNMVVQFFRNQNRIPKTNGESNVQELLEAQPAASETREFEIELKRQIFAWAAGKIKKQFKPTTWQAFWQTAIENRDVETVAAELGINRGAVYVSRSRVMKRLRDVVQTAVSQNESWCGFDTSNPQSSVPKTNGVEIKSPEGLERSGEL